MLPPIANLRGDNVTTIGKLLGAAVTGAVLLLGVAAYAQTTEPAKKAPKAKSACNALTEETVQPEPWRVRHRERGRDSARSNRVAG